MKLGESAVAHLGHQNSAVTNMNNISVLHSHFKKTNIDFLISGTNNNKLVIPLEGKPEIVVLCEENYVIFAQYYLLSNAAIKSSSAKCVLYRKINDINKEVGSKAALLTTSKPSKPSKRTFSYLCLSIELPMPLLYDEQVKACMQLFRAESRRIGIEFKRFIVP